MTIGLSSYFLLTSLPSFWGDYTLILWGGALGCISPTFATFVYYVVSVCSENNSMIVERTGLLVTFFMNIVLNIIIVVFLGWMMSSNWAALGAFLSTCFGLFVGAKVLKLMKLRVVVSSFALGNFTRSIFIRFLATIRYLVPGFRQLPENWWVTNFTIDLFTNPELLPRIAEKKPGLSLNGLLGNLKSRECANSLMSRSDTFFLVFFYAVPPFIYRLNIKATCWLYWPLFYLLRPALTKDTTEMRRRELCFPLSNPVQALIVGLGVVWFLASLLDIGQLKQITGWTGAPVYWEYLLIMDWSSLRLWDWAHLVTAVTGVGMIWIAGNALGNYKNNVDYSEECPSMVKVMTGLNRVRTLAVVVALGIALGSVVVNLKPEWVEEYVPVWAEGIQGFYRPAAE
ncbi:MAG: hypothetical protein GKR95_02115 [Gammaproteobacteria bacterium]|nr:hypothetical protein [Gammaproteobacteria bacterium]